MCVMQGPTKFEYFNRVSVMRWFYRRRDSVTLITYEYLVICIA